KQVKREIAWLTVILVGITNDATLAIILAEFACKNFQAYEQGSADIVLAILASRIPQKSATDLWNAVINYTNQSRAGKEIKDKWEQLKPTNSIKGKEDFLLQLSESTYSFVRIAALYSTFFINPADIKSLQRAIPQIIVNSVSNQATSIRDIAYSRLLSFCLTSESSKYVGEFWENIEQETNPKVRLYRAIGWSLLEARYGNKDPRSIFSQAVGSRSTTVLKGALIGLAMAENSAIAKDWMDERFLAFLEIFQGGLERSALFYGISYFLQNRQKA
ncbi:MAG TPA: hypothetical protein VJ044_16290, partial [Candidatus Hodarchaeales archaeon]|nr:hypothetical protein [Candidatus Hodarchaeales archaeon]